MACRTAEYDDSKPPPQLDRANIMAAIDGSLRRLQTDHIDLYQLHWPARYVPIFGKSQYNPENVRPAADFEELVQVCAAHVPEPLICRGRVLDAPPNNCSATFSFAHAMSACHVASDVPDQPCLCSSGRNLHR